MRNEMIEVVVKVLEEWHGERYGDALIKEVVGEKPLHVLDIVLAKKIVDALIEGGLSENRKSEAGETGDG